MFGWGFIIIFLFLLMNFSGEFFLVFHQFFFGESENEQKRVEKKRKVNKNENEKKKFSAELVKRLNKLEIKRNRTLFLCGEKQNKKVNPILKLDDDDENIKQKKEGGKGD